MLTELDQIRYASLLTKEFDLKSSDTHALTQLLQERIGMDSPAARQLVAQYGLQALEGLDSDISGLIYSLPSDSQSLIRFLPLKSN